MQTIQTKQKKSNVPYRIALLPYECEPMICVPDKCDPFECIKLIQNRNVKRHSTYTSTAYTFERSVSTPSFTSKTISIGANKTRPSTAATATVSPREPKDYKHDTHREPVIKLDGENSPRRQTVRISSSFSFNIDFYREDYPNQELHTLETWDPPRKETSNFEIKTVDKNANAMQSGNVSRENKNTQIKSNMQRNKASHQRKVRLGHTSSQISSSVKSKDKGTKYNLRRCFCTLKLAKQRDAATSIRKYPTFSNHSARTTGLSVTPVEITQAAKRSTEKKNDQKITMKLLARECEPGICIPGECNPYECQKFINIRHKKMAARSSGTENRKSKSAHSFTNRRVSSKSNDVQSSMLTSKRNVKVQRQHKVRKPRTHKVSQLSLQNVLSNPSNRQTVGMGSNFSFNVEFYKDKSPRQAEILTRETLPGFYVTSTPRFDSRSQSLTQHQRQTVPYRERASQEIIDNITTNAITARATTKKKGVLKNSAIKRCFCTLMLKKSHNMSTETTETITKNVGKTYSKPKNSTRGTKATNNKKNRGDNPSKISIRGHESQSSIVKKTNKATGIRPILKKCFCSLQLQNKTKSNLRLSRHVITTAMPAQVFYKNYNMWKTNKEELKYSSKKIQSPNIMHNNLLYSPGEQSGQDIKSKSESFTKRMFSSIIDYSRNNLLRQNNQFLKSSFYAMNVQILKQQKRKYKLEKYGCEPGVCLPGDCDPLDCVKRIQKRSTKRVSTSTSPGYGYTRMSRSKSVSSETARLHVTGQKNITECTRKPPCKIKRCIPSCQNERCSPLCHTLPPGYKQAVGIDSNFSFNIEFSKGMAADKVKAADVAKVGRLKRRKPCTVCTGTSCDYRPCVTKCTDVCKAEYYDRESQSSTTMYNKGSMVKPKYSRCLCTLALLNKRKDGIEFNMKEVSPKNIIKLSTRGQNTKKSKKSKNNDINYLNTYECKPNICIPSKCDPYKCIDIIKKRKKRINIGMGAGMKSRNVSTTSMYDAPTINKHGHYKSIVRQSRPQQGSRSFKSVTKSMIPSSPSSRQAVRIESNYDFNVEFYKNKSLAKENKIKDTPSQSYVQKSRFRHRINPKNMYNGIVRMSSIFRTSGVSNDSKLFSRKPQVDYVRKNTRVSGVGLVLKRCFCTSALYKEILPEELTNTKNVSKEKPISIGTNVQKDTPKANSRKGTLKAKHAALQSLKLPNSVRNIKYPDKTRPYKSKFRLEPYECKPGKCTPGECNPFECEKLIRKRLQKRKESGTSTVTHRARSATRSTTMFNKTRTIEVTKSHKKKQLVSSLTRRERGDHYKQAVRIESKFSFNVEFYKNGKSGHIPATHGEDNLSRRRNDQSFIEQLQSGKTISRAKLVHHRLQMGAFNLKAKSSSVGSLMKRCFCTLKLQKVGKQEKQSQLNVKPKFVTAFKDHSATTKMNTNAVIHKETGINSINKKIGAVDLYECELGVCIPGQCDQYKCLERTRKHGKFLKSACTMCEPMCTHKRCVAISCNLLPKCSKKLIQPSAPRMLSSVNKIRSSDLLQLSDSKIEPQLLSNNLQERQGVKYGSNVSFDIEFYKKMLYSNNVSVPDNSKNTKPSRTRIYDKNIEFNDTDINRFKKHNDTNTQYKLRNNAMQAKYGTGTKATATGNLLQRCFCTEKLRPSRKKHERKHIVTVGRVQEFQTLSPFKPSRYSYGKESCRCLHDPSKRTQNNNEEIMYNECDKLQNNMINLKPLSAITNPIKAKAKVKNKQSRRKTVSIQDPAQKEYTVVMLSGKKLSRNVSVFRDPDATAVDKTVHKIGAADVDVQIKHDKIIGTSDSKNKYFTKTCIRKVFAAENRSEKTRYTNGKEIPKFCTQTKLNKNNQNRTDCKLLNDNNTISATGEIIHKKLAKNHLVLPSAVCGKTLQNPAVSKNTLPKNKENKRKRHLKQLIATVIGYIKEKKIKKTNTKIARVLNEDAYKIIQKNKKKNKKVPEDYTVVKISGDNLSKNISSLHDPSGTRPETTIMTVGGTEVDFEVKRQYWNPIENHHPYKCNTTCTYCKCTKDKRIPKKNAKDNKQINCAGDNTKKDMETILPYKPGKFKNNCSRTCSSKCACPSCLCSKMKHKQVWPPCKRSLCHAAGQTYQKMTVFQRILSFFSNRKDSKCDIEKEKRYVGNRRNFNSIKRSSTERNVRQYYQPQRSNSALIYDENQNRKQTKYKYLVNTLFPNRIDLKCRNDIEHIISLNKQPKKIKRSKSERETQCVCFTELYQPKRCKSAKIPQCDIRDVGDPMNDIYRKMIKQRYRRSKFRKAHSSEFLIERKILCDGPELTKNTQNKRVKFALDPVIVVEKPIRKKVKMPKNYMGAVNAYIRNQSKCNNNHDALKGEIQEVMGDINTNYTGKAAPQKKYNKKNNYVEVKISGKNLTKSICEPRNPKHNTLVTVSGSYIGCEISKRTGTVPGWKGKCIKHNCTGTCHYCNLYNGKSKYSTNEKNKDKAPSRTSKNRETHSVIGLLKYIPDKNPRIKDYRKVRANRGSCRCCVCNLKIKKERVLQTIKKPEKCLCGSSKCAKQFKKEEAQKGAELKSKLLTRKPCICGSPACSSLAALAHSDTETLLKKLYRYMAKKNSCKCGSNVCDCINYLEQLKKKQEKLIKRQKMLQKLRVDRYTSDRKRIARQKKYDNYMTKKTKQNKKVDGALLWAESIMDLTKSGVNATTGVTRCVYRALTDPEQTKMAVKTAVKQPRRGIAVCMQGLRNSGVPAALKRIKMRFGNMLTVRLLKEGMKTFALTNFMLHFGDPDPTQRLKRIKKKRKIKKKEPLDFGCSPYMASLRKRPCLFIFYTCPWFYPHFISLITLWRQFTDVILFLLAVIVWSPCLLTLEVFRFFICCCLCTA